ncbi:MAG TPA: PQQ-dependent dehydrogenase, methanol/ethanol family [Steroidobacteraceae bacterium]|jgi:PQQ-dependent dehydrogenase (methanol/ethanol family)
MEVQRKTVRAGAPGLWSLIAMFGFGLAQASPAVDGARIANADAEPGNWLTYGRTYSEQRFSPLTKINAANARQLGLAWFADLDTNRGQEATPLVIDGVMYVSTAWSLVKAYDAHSGRLLWAYDPQVKRELGLNACCDVGNRGVAAWNHKIYVGAYDGRLVALDEATGKPVWSTMTVEAGKPYTITQAPRVIKGRVIIGNSGGEYGARGYISAYDAETGKLVWRFFTVPGDPSKPFENASMARAAKTWAGEWWKLGGGGPVWDAISYDPALNLVFFGVGNGVQWARSARSAGTGDNLFLSSIVALNADTGEYVWHYQATPGEEWDYDAVQQLVLADINIEGKLRHVLMQANKNGFFYVLDRKTGALISAKAIVPVTWASGIDMKTGRPIINKEARYGETGKPVDIKPGALGAHNWQPMAFNPKTGLVYIPAQQVPLTFIPLPPLPISPIGWNLGVALGSLTPQNEGFLLAWDPARQREAWRVTYKGPWNGGIVTTAGNIVAQGDAAGNFNVYRADNGEKLWSMFAQSGIIAAPSTFEAGGEQYIAVLSGWGGSYSLSGGRAAAMSGNLRNVSRMLVFKLGGTATLPPLAPRTLVINPPPEPTDAESIAKGEPLYIQYCSACHGENAIGGGMVPDLRASNFLGMDFFYNIVLDGALKDAGMASFKAALTRDDVTNIRNFVIHRANQDSKP